MAFASTDTSINSKHLRQTKKWHTLTDEERKEFLEYTNYSVQTENNHDVVVDSCNQALSKKGLKRAIRRWTMSKNRSKAKKRKKEKRKLKKNSNTSNGNGIIDSNENQFNVDFDDEPPKKRQRLSTAKSQGWNDNTDNNNGDTTKNKNGNQENVKPSIENEDKKNDGEQLGLKVQEKKARKVHLKGKDFRDFVSIKLDLMECPNVVIDCQFDGLMNSDDIVALSNQIYLLYARNNRAVKPFHLFLTSFHKNTRLWNKFLQGQKDILSKFNMNFIPYSLDQTIKYNEKKIDSDTKNGNGSNENSNDNKEQGIKYVNVYDIHNEQIEQMQRENNSSTNDNECKKFPESSQEISDFDLHKELNRMKEQGCFDELQFSKFKHENIVYLTAESENELKTIESDKLYVIGGWVDHNNYKGYVHQLAQKNKWKTAKLPIAKYMQFEKQKENVNGNENPSKEKNKDKDKTIDKEKKVEDDGTVKKKINFTKSRDVITVNQVFDILIGLWNWDQDWNKAFLFGLPTRKRLTLIDKQQEKLINKSSLTMDDYTLLVPAGVRHDTFKQTLEFIVRQRLENQKCHSNNK